MGKLAWFTVVATFVLMVWGNMVSATGSGLGCPDWPTCHGTFTPTPTFEVVLEWGHRLLAATAAIFIFTTLFCSIRSARSSATLKRVGSRVGISLGTLLILQILLGGLTVYLGLSVLASTIHLTMAHVIFAAVLLIALTSTYDDQIVLQDSKVLRRHSVLLLIALLTQIILGAWVRHSRSGLVCPTFPNCTSISFLPLEWTFSSAITFIHRWWAFVLTAVAITFCMRLIQTSQRFFRNISYTIFLAFCAQLALGIFVVYSKIDVALRGIHAGLGYLIWGLAIVTAIRLGLFSKTWRPHEPTTIDSAALKIGNRHPSTH